MGDGDRRILHLIYIHGFNGDHTTFQAFPTDLHAALAPRLAVSHPNYELKSSLYPTYKSRKALTESTQNFLRWMVKQPPADVILAGHSMGGLLASEAATSVSKHGKDHQVVGLLAFDTPFLGMHPHVVISGIASLFPQDDKKAETKSETELNDHNTVNIISETEVHQSQPEGSQSVISLPAAHPAPSQDDDEWDHFKSGKDSSKRSGSPSPKRNFLHKSLDFFAKHSQDPVVKFVKKHKDNPVGAAKTWVVEHFAFGIIMFEPQELLSRYKVLEEWNKPWVNYWTTTIERPVSRSHSPMSSEGKVDKGNDSPSAPDSPIPFEDYNSIGDMYQDLNRKQDDPSHKRVSNKSEPLLKPDAHVPHSTGEEIYSHASPTPTPSTRSHRSSSPLSSHSHEAITPPRPKMTKPRHFITKPSTRSASASAAKWEKVDVRGVKDEVAAHCGIFILTQNLEYEAFVERVAMKVVSWL